MKANQKNQLIASNLFRRGIDLPSSDVNTLRRAEMVLHRWAELECGNSNDYCSWCISRDEITGTPYMERHSNRDGKVSRYAVADREAGALKRVKAICDKNGLIYYHQGDPRGCALYIGTAEMLRGGELGSCYNRLAACCIN